MENAQETPAPTANKTLAAWSQSIDTNLKVFQQLTDFWANLTKESVSLYAELQASNLEALQEGKSSLFQWARHMPECVKQPADGYQQNVHAFAASADKMTRLFQNNVQAMFRSSEHCWLVAQQTGDSIKTSYTQLYDHLTSLYSPA